MSEKPKEEFIRTPARFRPQKLLKSAKAPSVDEAVKRAEAKIAEIAIDQPDWADEDLDRLTTACNNAEKDEENRKAHLDELYIFAHNLKGMGGNFGYPIVTDITSMLCRCAEHQPEPDMRVISLYVDSLRVVFENGLAGDGGKEGRTLVARLAKLSGKTSEVATDES